MNVRQNYYSGHCTIPLHATDLNDRKTYAVHPQGTEGCYVYRKRPPLQFWPFWLMLLWQTWWEHYMVLVIYKGIWKDFNGDHSLHVSICSLELVRKWPFPNRKFRLFDKGLKTKYFNSEKHLQSLWRGLKFKCLMFPISFIGWAPWSDNICCDTP